jgi:hypothetical protein
MLVLAALIVPAGGFAGTVASTTLTTQSGSTVRVGSVGALLTALANNNVTTIVVRNGTYRVSPAAAQRSNSLWIGARFAKRTRAVIVRAETRGGVTFDGGGSHYFGGLSFESGAHDQIWDGFRFANGEATDTGVVTFGGYSGKAAPHHIRLRYITFLSSLHGHTATTDHAIYVAQALHGPHDLVFNYIKVDGTGSQPLSSGLHFYHHNSTNPNAWNVIVRHLTINGTSTGIAIWDSTLHDIRIDTATITGARFNAIQYEQPGRRIVLANIVTRRSGQLGFYSSYGRRPPGVTFINNSFH